MTKTILLIGGYSSGKTHFGAQLLSRLNLRSGQLRASEAPTNIALFESVLQKLGQGLSSDHTESGMYGEVILPTVSESGQRLDLVWPDYAGEQVTGELGIAEVRAVPAHWIDKIARSDHWVLMVRPMAATEEDDLLNRPIYDTPSAAPPEKEHRGGSAQLRLIELLQILRHVKGVSNLKAAQSPRLLLLLSCWDELPIQDATPSQVLSERLPMLSSFLRANWQPDSLLTYGLSSLGKSLSHDKVDEGYQNRGPESFGFIVLPTGQKLSDLTLAIAHLAT